MKKAVQFIFGLVMLIAVGVTKHTVYVWIADKAMPAHKIGKLWKFQISEVDEWVRRGGSAASGGEGERG
jgi:excisionase family DNA binding protein